MYMNINTMSISLMRLLTKYMNKKRPSLLFALQTRQWGDDERVFISIV